MRSEVAVAVNAWWRDESGETVDVGAEHRAEAADEGDRAKAGRLSYAWTVRAQAGLPVDKTGFAPWAGDGVFRAIAGG